MAMYFTDSELERHVAHEVDLAIKRELATVQAERDALKTDNQRLQAEILALDLLPHTQKLKRLEAELAQARQERDSWHKIVKDFCDDDEKFRTLAGEYDNSSSYGVESHAEILEKVLTQLRRRGVFLEWVIGLVNEIERSGHALKYNEIRREAQEALKEAP